MIPFVLSQTPRERTTILQQDVTDMRRAAQFWRCSTPPRGPRFLREVATAADLSHPIVSLDEQLRWSMVVVRATDSPGLCSSPPPHAGVDGYSYDHPRIRFKRTLPATE